MKFKSNYSKNIDNQISYLKKNIGQDNAKEDLRRFAHHLRNYEYSGEFENSQSKLLVKAEIIKTIFMLCTNSIEDKNINIIEKLLHHTFELNFKLNNYNLTDQEKLELFAKEINNLDLDNQFLILVVKTKESDFTIVIEKFFEGITEQSKKFIAQLLTKIYEKTLSYQEIFSLFNSSLKYIKDCPIKVHFLNKNQTSNRIAGLVDINRNSNIRIYNFFSGNVAVGYSKLYETPKRVSNFYSLNIVYAISYILAKKNLSVNLDEKKITKSDDALTADQNFSQNVEKIIESTINRLAETDKYVIGSIDRKFNLNKKVSLFPDDVKQININELDENGLKGLKKLVKLRIKKVSRLKKLTSKLANDKFENFVDQNYKFIPQIVLDQSRIVRAKEFYKKGLDARKRKDFLLADKLFDEAVKSDSRFKEAFFERGYNKYLQENFASAVEDFTKVIELDPSYEEAFHVRGLCYSKMKNIKLAIDDFSYLLKNQKGNAA
jgi:tetratricopeptide (TPR) repeat protein